MSDTQGIRRIHPVILSGGAGTRLWPVSRALYPKQLMPLVSQLSMLQETVSRTGDGASYGGPIVVCNEEHRFLVAEQLRRTASQPVRVVLEPSGRNTAPALAVAALMLTASDPEAMLLAQPSDHAIDDLAAFHRAVTGGSRAAAQGRLVTFGIRPKQPDTGFGYIQTGSALPGIDGVFSVGRFVEKPDAATATAYLASGDYLWNSGIFLFHAASYLRELERLQPELLRCCERAVKGGSDEPDFFRLDAGAFNAAPSISVDHAVMEKTTISAVVPVEMGWSDIGSWRALRDVQPKDRNGNVVVGDVMAEGVSNSYLRSDGPLVAALGLDDMIVVATDDALLVASARRAGDVGRLVERLRESDRPELQRHRKVHRPWGYYETLDAGERFQAKRIMVHPGARLSLQKHRHRAEHWVVVSGTARVTRDEETTLLHENESIFIPLGARHRLENPGTVPLLVIEIQSGTYLGEDDIVRLEDVYGRR